MIAEFSGQFFKRYVYWKPFRCQTSCFVRK